MIPPFAVWPLSFNALSSMPCLGPTAEKPALAVVCQRSHPTYPPHPVVFLPRLVYPAPARTAARFSPLLNTVAPVSLLLPLLYLPPAYFLVATKNPT